ncbi:MAG TPA: hypothetical protein VFW87_09050 [Pirellulales bacterium]|nr:hypothetical protein [Pirellulales bacterium]
MITTSSDIQTYLGLASMTALATQVQALAEAHVKDFLGWQEVEQQTWVEYYPREQGATNTNDPHYIVASNHQRAVPGFYFAPNIIQLQQLPVRSITEVREDATGYFGQVAGSFGANTLLQSGSDYFLKTEQGGIAWSGQLVRRAFWFPATIGSVMVTYVAGFTAAELSGRWQVFKTAVLETAGDLYLRAKAFSMGHKPDIASEADGGGVSASYVYNRLASVSVPDAVADMLQPYVNYGEMAL